MNATFLSQLLNVVTRNFWVSIGGRLLLYENPKGFEVSEHIAIYVSNPPPGFILQMDFAFFNVETILGFTSTFLGICSATSYSFGFPYRSKIPPLGILKFLVTILRNQDEKVAFV